MYYGFGLLFYCWMGVGYLIKIMSDLFRCNFCIVFVILVNACGEGTVSEKILKINYCLQQHSVHTSLGVRTIKYNVTYI